IATDPLVPFTLYVSHSIRLEVREGLMSLDVAVALVVDSSHVLASEWPFILSGYIFNMLRRIGEASPKCKFRVAFISYGTQEDDLNQRFFEDFRALSTTLGDVSKMNLGGSSSGGGNGLAALDGLVAAIELFDDYARQSQNSAAHHIFHVAAVKPDHSTHPQRNRSPELDSLTWGTLPSELKKRHINFSSICLKKGFDKFGELHTASFDAYRLTHELISIRLLPSPLCNHGFLCARVTRFYCRDIRLCKHPFPRVCIKRAAAEPASMPETKRPKANPPVPQVSPPKNINASPVPVPMTAPPTALRMNAPVGPPAVPVGAAAQGPAGLGPGAPLMQSGVPGLPPLSPQRLQQLQTFIRTCEQQIRTMELSASEALARGDRAAAEEIMAQVAEKKKSLQQLMQKIVHNMNQNRLQVARSMPPNGPAAPAPPMNPQQPMAAEEGGDFQMLGPDAKNASPAAAMSAMSGHMRSASNGRNMPPMNAGAATMMGNAPGPTNLTQQMQKLMEQKDRAQQTGMQPGPAGPNPSQPPPPPPQHVPVWQGLMTWSGPNAAGVPREISLYVVAKSGNRDTCHATTWPQTLKLSMTESAVSVPELQMWMKRYNPVIVTFAPNPRASQPAQNDLGYKALVAILLKQQTFFVASWALPNSNGKETPNALFFPSHQIGLAGLFFPLTGIPEMPKTVSGHVVPVPPPPGLPPATNGLATSAAAAAAAAASPQTQQIALQIQQMLSARGVAISAAFAIQVASLPAQQRGGFITRYVALGAEQRRKAAAAAAAAQNGGQMAYYINVH
ncbi:unnamed protein product, partial [Mycena citricolor]